jgi:hypothetical protein
MSHSHTNYVRPRLFRVFVTNRYWANRDEYDGVGQRQPHTFEQYASNNMAQLRRDFKLHKQKTLARS